MLNGGVFKKNPRDIWIWNNLLRNQIRNSRKKASNIIEKSVFAWNPGPPGGPPSVINKLWPNWQNSVQHFFAFCLFFNWCILGQKLDKVTLFGIVSILILLTHVTKNVVKNAIFETLLMIFFLQDSFWVCRTINCQIYHSSYFSDLKSFVLIKGVVFDHNKKIRCPLSGVMCHVPPATSQRRQQQEPQSPPPAPSQMSSVTYQVLGAMCQVSGVPC